MSNPILGIDPGLKGALAFVSKRGDLLGVFKMPTYRQERSRGKFKTFVDGAALTKLIDQFTPDTYWIEDVFSSSQMGVVSSFSFGEGKGILKGIAAARGIEPFYVHPAVWKRDIGVTSEKRSSIIKAKRLFPFQQKLLTSEGKCEAALIALYGLLTSGIFSLDETSGT
jgi:Holliday junction resolvasome RuvABC endonuclease subunit